MTLTMGKHELELGGPYLGMLREANGLLHDPAALHARMEEDGYLLLRGLHDRAKVEAARRSILEGLDANAQLDQSRPLDSRATFEARFAAMAERFAGGPVPRPPHWSGFRLRPERIEFWRDMPFRLHDRQVFHWTGEGWRTEALYP